VKKTPKISKEVLALRKAKAYKRAYADIEFMSRKELRPVRLQLELLKPEMILAEHDVRATVVVFGSARTRSAEQTVARETELKSLLKKSPGDAALKVKLAAARSLRRSAKYYEVARDFAKLVACNDCTPGYKLTVVTGGGPGIMEAANRGAHESGAKSIGLNITLDMEQGPNPYVSPEFCFRFHYFAVRKMHFVMRARALVVFPGGFGTFDELFEVLTLIQTGKKRVLPIVMVGKEYWDDIMNFPNMAKWGYIAKEDLKLFRFAETAEEIWGHITGFYQKHPLDVKSTK